MLIRVANNISKFPSRMFLHIFAHISSLFAFNMCFFMEKVLLNSLAVYRAVKHPCHLLFGWLHRMRVAVFLSSETFGG